ncbi:MFS transporter [Nocardioides albus]|uniref:EmrB/QacA subfamily drug resistance transporter n=1 Tax=Nocardioides albus TaxID=1841 RepID=A0A7W5F875_9ACTN|nr:MFS transporter [Nocardioides albus]MBB3088602.1 EmrB/QacA subfamily drug resistance transporter [Nocardioides albus]GGU17444.1 MFS transporter [Nocardioides albus]
MATTTAERTHAGPPGGSSDGSPKTLHGQMSHREIMEALSGLLLGMFVAMISSTIVSNALPEIIADIGGGQSAYTWVVTSTLLTMTATTPLWGKMADLFSKKLLMQIALVLFVAASAVAGLAQNPEQLIAARAIQGIGMGGLTALAQIIMAAMISPRERGRYSGYLGAVFAVATVGGPLLGGVITDADSLGWRWCFYVGIPFAIVAFIVLQKTLHLPVVKREGVKVDWAGAFFMAAGVCLLLVWVTFAGDKYDWASWETAAMVGGSVALLLIFGFVESRAAEPIVPLRLFRNRTITLSSLASLFVGVAMFAGTIFFSQYFQLARDKSPTMAGVMTIPMIAGLFLSSTISGQVITRTGKWKAWLVVGATLIVGGLGMLGTIRYDTEYWHVAIFMAVLGLGVGMTMQNLVLSTQNQVAPADLGAASSMVTFFRSLGGAMGVSALGALMANRVGDYVKDGLADLGPKYAAMAQATSGEIPDMDKVPEPLRTVLESAYGHGIADIFLVAAAAAVVALVFVVFIKEVPLKTKGGIAQAAEDAADVDGPAAVAEAVAGVPEQHPAADSAPTANGIPLHGFVRGAGSVPVPHAAVTLISLSGRQLGRSVAHADGSYAVDAPSSGTYVLIASADGFQPQASTVVVGGEPVAYDLLLSGTTGLKGIVRSGEDGAPIQGAMVIVTDVRGDLLSTGTTVADGTFFVDELVPGPATVAVNAEGYRPHAVPIEIGATGVTRVEVGLVTGARLTGVVKAAFGPLGDARVTLVDAAGNVVGTATTGEDGAYAFADLDGGDYTVLATSYPPAASAVSLTGPGVDGHEIVLSHPED